MELVIESFDEFVFRRRGEDWYFENTNIRVYEVDKIKGFMDSDKLKRLKTEPIPIYRLYKPSEDDCNLYATDYFLIPYEDSIKTNMWRGYYKPNFSYEIDVRRKMRNCNFGEMFEEGGRNFQLLIEEEAFGLYQLSFLDEYGDIKYEQKHVFYSSNINVGTNNVIDDYYMEWMINVLDKKREFVTKITDNKVECFMKNVEDFRLRNELLGEYGLIKDRCYLFKIAEIEFETFISLSSISNDD